MQRSSSYGIALATFGALVLTPSTGHRAGHELLVITGVTFEDGATVTIGGRQADVLEQTDSQVVVETPAGAGNQEVVVTHGGRRDTGSTFYIYSPVQTAEDYHFQADTDRWFLDVQDDDGDGQPDLAQALATAQNSTGGAGFANADDAMRQILRNCVSLYRNDADGRIAQGGAPLSFQATAPAYGRAPEPALTLSGSSVLDHNVMAFRNVGQLTDLSTSPLGAAQFEDGANTRYVNNSAVSPQGGDPLGVFPDAIVFNWNQAPIPASRRTLEALCREIGHVLAHEVGHSIGLDHVATTPTGATHNVMAASAPINPTNVYAFDQATFASLLGWLPGTNRCSHRTAWSPRRLLAEADVVVVGRPMAVTGDTLELQVEQVLAGQARVGYQRVAGMDTSHAAEAMTPGTLSLLFLRRTPQGLAFTNMGAAGGVDLTGRDRAAWAELITAHQALAQRRGADYVRGSADLLIRSLDANDARIRIDAWTDLAYSPEVVAALTPAQVQRVVAGLDAGPVVERALAAQVLIQRADPTLAPTLLDAALGEDEPVVLAELAGALEAGMGLRTAADQLKTRLTLAPTQTSQARARGAVVLAWLHDGAAVDQLTAGMAPTSPGSPVLRRAIPSLRANGLRFVEDAPQGLNLGLGGF